MLSKCWFDINTTNKYVDTANNISCYYSAYVITDASARKACAAFVRSLSDFTATL